MTDHAVSWLIIFSLSQKTNFDQVVEQTWSTLIKHNRTDVFSVFIIFSMTQLKESLFSLQFVLSVLTTDVQYNLFRAKR